MATVTIEFPTEFERDVFVRHLDLPAWVEIDPEPADHDLNPQDCWLEGTCGDHPKPDWFRKMARMADSMEQVLKAVEEASCANRNAS